MVLYLREITLASKSGDSVYAKRLFLKTHVWHPCREAPLGAFKNRGTKQNRRFVYAKYKFFLRCRMELTPQVATCRRMNQDFSGLFGKLLCRLRKTTTFGTMNANIILDVLPKVRKTLFSQ